MNNLLKPYAKGGLSIKNSIAMAPMTRSRAINNIPNALMAEYYGQRSGAGLIITEGTAPTKDGLGYCRIPGIYSREQIEGWKLITDAVHKDGAKIFIQLMHTGRISHIANMPDGAKVVSSSNIKAAGQMYTDTNGMQDHPTPEALTTEGVHEVIEEFVTGAQNAVEADFDGIELHSANGYMFEQFLNPNVNTRTDEFGGSMENRAKFVLTIAEKTANAIGKVKVGVKFSPYSTFNDMQPYDREDVHETYTYLAAKLNELDIAYLHIGLNPDIDQKTLDAIRSNFNGTLILNGGYTAETAETALENGAADVIAFGRNYLANPDFEKRLDKDAVLNPIDFNTFYSADEKGYTDYPFLGNN